MLEIVKLRKSFGGVHAVDGVNFTVEKGELSSIIGPNGAGKSTLFNLISGYLRPDSGEVVFMKKNITGAPRHKIVKMGISRSFQVSSYFTGLDVLSNVRIAILSSNGNTLNMLRKDTDFPGVEERALGILGKVGLEGKQSVSSSSLSHGDKKRLEVGIVLATNPSLLLLDEPTAGMSQEERMDTMRLIEKICREMKLAVIFTEHDMDVVFSISEKIRVMDHGKFIAEGTPKEISRNPIVKAAYLGE
jgi:branched-chain amino acid transport system ATP-binding protein